MRLFIISIFILCIISMVFGQASEKQTDTGRQGGGKASVIGQTDANRETGHVQHNKDDALTRDPSDTDLDKKIEKRDVPMMRHPRDVPTMAKLQRIGH